MGHWEPHHEEPRCKGAKAGTYGRRRTSVGEASFSRFSPIMRQIARKCTRNHGGFAWQSPERPRDNLIRLATDTAARYRVAGFVQDNERG